MTLGCQQCNDKIQSIISEIKLFNTCFKRVKISEMLTRRKNEDHNKPDTKDSKSFVCEYSQEKL